MAHIYIYFLFNRCLSLASNYAKHKCNSAGRALLSGFAFLYATIVLSIIIFADKMSL